MPGPIIARKLIQMGLDLSKKQVKKNIKKATPKKKDPIQEFKRFIDEDYVPQKRPSPTTRTKAFYKQITKD
jgi:hypothetical protein|tara:strand:- start:269 stop:481 length:213 start_codon:yes stop_codon:yes gene_type:complete